MKQKLKAWLQRYLLAEITGTITALIAASIVQFCTHQFAVSAFAGTWGENFGYYGYILLFDIMKSRKQHRENYQKYGIFSFLKDIRNLILEFGIPEWLDSGLIRPFFMYTFPRILGNFTLGIIAGKIAADIVFYMGVITTYELRKKHFKD